MWMLLPDILCVCVCSVHPCWGFNKFTRLHRSLASFFKYYSNINGCVPAHLSHSMASRQSSVQSCLLRLIWKVFMQLPSLRTVLSKVCTLWRAKLVPPLCAVSLSTVVQNPQCWALHRMLIKGRTLVTLVKVQLCTCISTQRWKGCSL